MRITLVRHGETEANYLSKIQGRSNPLLNDTGRRQCQKLRNRISNNHYDICYTSPLIRCVETALILIGDRVEFIRDSRLIERDMGDLEGKDYSLYDKYKYWDYDLNSNDENVEKIQDLFFRCQEFLNYIKKTHPKDESILIVTHGASYRALRYLLRNHPLKGHMYDSKIENCQLEEFQL
ncbi:MAG: histidine phosphatase family protein [Bacilli bacterium]|nr:histidine phosphatase family protein [Bacilli bacterium]